MTKTTKTVQQLQAFIVCHVLPLRPTLKVLLSPMQRNKKLRRNVGAEKRKKLKKLAKKKRNADR